MVCRLPDKLRSVDRVLEKLGFSRILGRGKVTF
jgi:hypothetical protein